MQHHHDRGAALAVELGQQVEHVDLVGDVEEGRRLVEQQHPGPGPAPSRSRPAAAARRTARRPGARPAPGVGGASTAATASSSSALQRRNTPWCGCRPRPTRSADGDALGRERLLRQQAEQRGDLRGASGGCPAPSSITAPAAGRAAGQTAQQRGLPAAVGAHDHRHRPAAPRGRRRATTRPVVGQAQVARGERPSCRRGLPSTVFIDVSVRRGQQPDQVGAADAAGDHADGDRQVAGQQVLGHDVGADDQHAHQGGRHRAGRRRRPAGGRRRGDEGDEGHRPAAAVATQASAMPITITASRAPLGAASPRPPPARRRAAAGRATAPAAPPAAPARRGRRQHAAPAARWPAPGCPTSQSRAACACCTSRG